jgi:hypothetical protein
MGPDKPEAGAGAVAPGRLLYVLYSLLLAAVAAVWAWCFWPRGQFLADTVNYLHLAQGRTVGQPFCGRLLVPGLVRLLPLPPHAGFFLITYASLAGFLWCVHRLLRRLEVPPLSAAAVPLLLLTSYPVGFYLFNWGTIDATMHFLGAAFLLAVLLGRRLLAAALLLAAVFTKETGILLAPLLVLAAPEPGPLLGARRLLRAAWAAAPALLLFLAIRAWAPRVPTAYDVHGLADFATLVRSIWDYNCAETGVAPRLAREFLRSYGFFWSLAAAGLLLARRTRLTLTWLYLIACGFLLCLVATDWSRMLGFGALGVFVPLALFLARVEQAGRCRLVGLITALGCLQGYLSLIGYAEVPPELRPALLAAIAGVFLAGSLAGAWAAWAVLWPASCPGRCCASPKADTTAAANRRQTRTMPP